jgi:acyl-homoserine lactone acylase PvdQ
MVIALGPSGVRGQNILPGGQSGFPTSDHFDDQAAMWLANTTIPMRYLPEEVADGAVSVERFFP